MHLVLWTVNDPKEKKYFGEFEFAVHDWYTVWKYRTMMAEDARDVSSGCFISFLSTCLTKCFMISNDYNMHSCLENNFCREKSILSCITSHWHQLIPKLMLTVNPSVVRIYFHHFCQQHLLAFLMLWVNSTIGLHSTHFYPARKKVIFDGKCE